MIPKEDRFLMRWFPVIFWAAIITFVLSIAAESRADELCWQNPTENTDATLIDDLDLVRIRYSDSSILEGGTIVAVEDVPTNVPGETVCVETDTFSNPPSPGDWYFVATALDVDGNESAYSNEVMKTITADPASPYVLEDPTQEGSVSHSVTLLIGETGIATTIYWSGGSGTTEVELLEYGDTVPVMSGQFTSSTQWDFIPRKAGLYFTRMRSCDPDCGPWLNSYDLGYMYFFKLADPTPGGID